MKKLLVAEHIESLKSLPNLRVDLSKDTVLKLEHGHRVKMNVQTPTFSGTLFVAANILLADNRIQLLD